MILYFLQPCQLKKQKSQRGVLSSQIHLMRTMCDQKEKVQKGKQEYQERQITFEFLPALIFLWFLLFFITPQDQEEQEGKENTENCKKQKRYVQWPFSILFINSVVLNSLPFQKFTFSKLLSWKCKHMWPIAHWLNTKHFMV